jgi:hypothetical protein
MSSPDRDLTIGGRDLHSDASAPLAQITGNQKLDALLRALPLFCAVAVLWLATRHYFGIVQDARFYMIEALHELNPSALAEDMYFKFGSQGSFSLFSRLYAPFVSHFGVDAAGMGFTIVGQLCWVLALAWLGRSWVGERFMWLSLATVIAMPNTYAFFGYGEDFATPRLFAEALTMLALALLRSRPVWTLVLLGFSAALHPLMTLPGLVVIFVYFALGRFFLWLVLPASAALAIALGWAGIQPFANLLETIDPAWFSIIQVRSAQCLLTSWTSSSRIQTLVVLAWASVAVLVTTGRERRFVIAALVAGVGGLLLAFIGGDIARNVFVIELQPWRSVWLLQVVTRIYVPVIFFSLLAKRSANAFPLAVLLTIGLILVSSITRLIRLPYAAEFTDVSLVLVTGGLAVFFVQSVLIAERYRYIRLASSCLALALVPIALLGWDVRTPWTKFVESSAMLPSALIALVPQNESIYWEGSTEMLWLKLKRPSYFSCTQGTGVVFHRDTAMTYRHRAESFWPLRLYDLDPSSDCQGFNKAQNIDRTPARLQKICRREPGLDTLVLMKPIPGLRPRIWKSSVQFEDIHMIDGKLSATAANQFYVYSCAGIR